MRNDVFREYYRSNVLDERFLQRRILQLRFARIELNGRPTRKPYRSDGLRIPENDQVHLPEVRSKRKLTDTRRSVRATVEHNQRKSLHHHLVFVRHFGHCVRFFAVLSIDSVFRADRSI